MAANWFTNLASQAIQLADNLADTIATKANEVQSDILNEQNKIKSEENRKKEKLNSNNQLPWETNDESKTICSQDLMEKILALSLSESNFTTPPEHFDPNEFILEDFVPIALRLLSLDNNLSRVHAKLTPHMHEEEFWRNYSFRITYLRLLVGIVPVLERDRTRFTFSKEEVARVIFQADAISISTDELIAKSQADRAKSRALAKKSSETTKLSPTPNKELSKQTVPLNQSSSSSKAVEEEEEKEQQRQRQDAELAAEVQKELGDDMDLDDLGDLGDLDELDEGELIGDILGDDKASSGSGENLKSDHSYDKLSDM